MFLVIKQQRREKEGEKTTFSLCEISLRGLMTANVLFWREEHLLRYMSTYSLPSFIIHYPMRWIKSLKLSFSSFSTFSSSTSSFPLICFIFTSFKINNKPSTSTSTFWGNILFPFVEISQLWFYFCLKKGKLFLYL